MGTRLWCEPRPIPTQPPLTLSIPTPSTLPIVPHAIDDGVRLSPALATGHRLHSLDLCALIWAPSSGAAHHERTRGATYVKASGLGLVNLSRASHNNEVAGNVTGLEPRAYPKGDRMRKKPHRLENLTPSSKGPTGPPPITTV